MTSREPAPGALETVRLFVNTLDIESGSEQLTSPERLRDWLASRGLLAPDDATPTSADLARALEVREAVRALLLAHHGEPLDPEAVARLNAAAGDARLVVRFLPDGRSELAPSAQGVEGAIGRLLAIVAAAEADGSWDRMKACRRDRCRWAFYDRSKNHSSRWCSMEVCGNKEKAKAYRARQKREAHA